jgi:putative transposase
VAVKHRIDELFTACPFYGSRKLVALLEPDFGPIARNTVRSYMHEMGIAAIAPGPNLSRRNPEQRVYPYLLRGVRAARPNHVWGIEIVPTRCATSYHPGGSGERPR